MDPRQENRERLAKLGIVVDDHGAFGVSPESEAAKALVAVADPNGEPETKETPAPAVAPALPPAPEPPKEPASSAPPSESPKTPTPALDEAQVQALERRAEAAKNEQRSLSKLQSQVRQDLEEMRKLADELRALRQPPAAQTAAPAPNAEALEALRQASPALFDAIVAAIQGQVHEAVGQAVAPVLQVKSELETHKQALAKSAADEAYDKVTSAVEAGRKGALDLVNGDDFQAWLLEQPEFIRVPAIKAIYEDTSSADPNHILWVIKQYDKAKAPAAPQAPAPRIAPTIPLASVPAGGKASADGPLSEAELADFGRLKAAVEHDPAALAKLMTRLRLTHSTTS